MPFSTPAMCCNEIIRGCCIEQSTNKAHERPVPRGTRAPDVNHSVVVTVDKESFPCPVGPPRCCCDQDGVVLSRRGDQQPLSQRPAQYSPYPKSLASVNNWRGCPVVVKEETLAVPVRCKLEPPVKIRFRS